MKIIPGTIPYKYSAQNETAKNAATQSSSKKITNSFDKIILSAKTEIPEDKFASDLANKITKEICTQTSTRDLEEIKSQIEDGTYHIGLDEIAKKMMIC